MKSSGSLGKIFVLFLLIIVLIFGGLLWFDYLGLLHVRSLFAPVYSVFGLNVPQGVSPLSSDESANLDDDRYRKRLEALEIKSQELAKLEKDIINKQKENKQISEELDDRRNVIEEKEKNFNAVLLETNDRKANLTQIAVYMNGMPPEKAVANILEMDDQDIIDIFREVENIAKKDGKSSMVSYWFSLMPPARAAEIQRKMSNSPVVLP